MKVEFFSSSGGGGGGTTISLTTTGTSGASTLSGAGVLNIPIYADENTNIGNTNLVSNATTRTYGIANGGTLTFKTFAGTNALQVNNSGDVVIGGATPYTMPNARGTTNEILGLTDNSGNVEWRTLASVMSTKQQSLAVNNYIAFPLSVVANNVYGGNADRMGFITDLGLNTATTINTSIGQPITKTDPFRQLSTTNINFNGTMMIKFLPMYADTYKFYVIAVEITNGSAPATSPVTYIQLGFDLIVGSKNRGFWQCLELQMPIAPTTPCTAYYFGISPATSGTNQWSCIANYTQVAGVTNSFS